MAIKSLIKAEQIAGKSEVELNKHIFSLALEMFGIEKYWHKRMVRSGLNTLYPYKENPPNRIIQQDIFGRILNRSLDIYLKFIKQ